MKTADWVFYDGAASKSNNMGAIDSGTKVEVLAMNKQMARVRLPDGRVVFVRNRLLDKTQAPTPVERKALAQKTKQIGSTGLARQNPYVAPKIAAIKKDDAPQASRSATPLPVARPKELSQELTISGTSAVPLPQARPIAPAPATTQTVGSDLQMAPVPPARPTDLAGTDSSKMVVPDGALPDDVRIPVGPRASGRKAETELPNAPLPPVPPSFEQHPAKPAATAAQPTTPEVPKLNAGNADTGKDNDNGATSGPNENSAGTQVGRSRGPQIPESAKADEAKPAAPSEKTPAAKAPDSTAVAKAPEAGDKKPKADPPKAIAKDKAQEKPKSADQPVVKKGPLDLEAVAQVKLYNGEMCSPRKEWQSPMRETYRVTDCLGSSRDGGSRRHAGIDMAGKTPGTQGIPIFAAASGTVIQSGHEGGYGCIVYVKHPTCPAGVESFRSKQGCITRYSHLQAKTIKLKKGKTRRVCDVPEVGTKVTSCSRIGGMSGTGSRGRPTDYASHLHFEVRDISESIVFNPTSVLPAILASSDYQSAGSASCGKAKPIKSVNSIGLANGKMEVIELEAGGQR